MAGSLLLDTNAAIAFLKRDPLLLSKLAPVTYIVLSSVAVGELFYGAYRSTQVLRNLQRIETFAAANTVLVCDAATARQYGEIKQALRLMGKPIPDNDIWIAAQALQYALPLLTRDQHFTAVSNLLLETW